MSSRKSSSKSKNSSSTEEIIESNISVKLRRLKLNENLLSKDLGKSSNDLEDEAEDEYEYCYWDSKNLFNKLKVSYIDIRDLFEELKVNTSTEDSLQTLDIEDVKKNVMNIEAKIKQFKTFMQTKLKSLKSEEQELINQIGQIPDELFITKEQKKVHIKPFTDIVPSPVKVLINSPFKCQEVQEFQKFLSNSKNQYGGWILYHHNIFENCWQKHFSLETNAERNQNLDNIQVFIQDVHRKMPDVSFDEIKLHIDWYTKYLYLKERQQKALEKWKRKKELLRKPLKKQSYSPHLQSTDENNSNKLCSKSSTKLTCYADSKLCSNDYVNELVSDELQIINEHLSDEIRRCMSTERNSAEFNQLINETIDLKASSSGSVSTISKVQTADFVAKVTKTTIRSFLTYKNTTEQWHHRCNGEKDLSLNYMDVESLMKR